MVEAGHYTEEEETRLAVTADCTGFQNFLLFKMVCDSK